MAVKSLEKQIAEKEKEVKLGQQELKKLQKQKEIQNIDVEIEKIKNPKKK